MPVDLTTLGWSPFFEERWRQLAAPGLVPARIAADHGDAWEAWAADGSGWAVLAGRLRDEARETGFPGAGDWVALDAAPGPDRPAVIQRVLERRTAFYRGAAGREARLQVVAANVDRVFVVCGLDEDFNLHRIERFAARVWASGAQPVVLLSKADLTTEGALRAIEVESRLPGVEVLTLCALRGEGLDAVRSRILPGETVALVGSSGAGKSTLANALLGEERLATGPVRERDGRGQHVTSHRQLLLLPGGGLLLDTPGMRELQLPDEEGLDAVFEDVAELARRCRFSDCTHGEEPGCAVRAAVDAGELEEDRLAHFVKLREEARSWERRHDPRLGRADDRAWGRFLAQAQREVRRTRGK
jgi:ribosome biogenesis GTPase